MTKISDRIAISLGESQTGGLTRRAASKVSRSALPMIASLAAIFLAFFPIPGSLYILTGGVLAAALLYDPDRFGGPVSDTPLKPLFSPALPKARIQIPLAGSARLPDAAPRGIKDEGGCSALNANLQMIESSGPLTDWLMESPPVELAAFRDFYQLYRSSGGPLTSISIRATLELVFPWPHSGVDPFDLLAFILDLAPKELKGIVRAATHYNAPAESDSRLTVKEVEIPIITLEIRGSEPHLEKMLNAFYNERSIGYKRAEAGPDGKVRTYRATHIERRFITAPPELWFHIARFENVVQKSIFHDVPVLKSIFTPIAAGVSRNTTPVWIPQEITVKPLQGPEKTYRLNAFLVHEGSTSLEERVKVYRIKDGVLYGCQNQWIVKISHPAQQEILSQAYLLHYEPA